MITLLLLLTLATDLPRVRAVEVVAKTTETITLTWQKVTGAKSYHLRVLQKQNGDWEQIRLLSDIRTNTKRIKKLDPDTRYRFQVRAIRKAERGLWSKALTVRTEPLEEEENKDDENDNKSDCTSNQVPEFSVDITDVSAISQIIQPPSTGTGGLKTHAFIYTDLAVVPVYAPVDSSLTGGAFYLEGNEDGEYVLVFQATCEITFRYDHITEPGQAIIDAFPAEPKDNTITEQLAEPIQFAAGDLVGYTTGTIYGVWDFGVYNSEVQNQFSDDPEYNTSEVYTTAVCPFDFFPEDQRQAYYALFAKTDEQMPEGATEFCLGA